MSKIIYPIGGFAPGHYICKCRICEEQFLGDKRSAQCEPCAINSVNSSNTQALAQLSKLKSSLENIVISSNSMKEMLKTLNNLELSNN